MGFLEIDDVEVDPRRIQDLRTQRAAQKSRMCACCHQAIPLAAEVVVTKNGQPAQVDCLVDMLRKWLYSQGLLNREGVIRISNKHHLVFELQRLTGTKLKDTQLTFIAEHLEVLEPTVN